MQYGELFKNFDAREISQEPNPCVKQLGLGPEGKKCKECHHLTALHYANTYYKCDLRQNTNGPSTDHRVNWRACSKFKQSGM
jgi:hypothetical protein